MGIQFREPWFLLLLIPLAGFAVWAWRSKLRMEDNRKRLAVGLRTLILLLLLTALAGMQWFVTLERQAVFYIVDRSDSMPAGSQSYEQWLKTSAEARKDQDLIGVISAGGNAVVERSLSLQALRQFSFSGEVNRQFSNMAQGMQLAAGLMPEDAAPRIVLITDGQENVGDLLRQGQLLNNKGVAVDVLPIPAPARKDVAIENVKLPENLYQAEKYALEIQLSSTFAATGELRVYEDNRELTRQTVSVERGDNRFALQGLAKEPGFHRYRAEIYFEGDEQAVNNAGYAFSRVSGPPKVLIVEGTPGSSGNLESVMASGLIGYETIAPEMLPLEIADYTGYDSMILNNVSATRMSGMQMEMIEKAVKDHGIGLVMIGGEDSYGMGGYFKTPIERALPVSMELEGKREIPSLGLILVIDRSGSMDGDKLELAKEAAMRTVELMREKDSVGVVAFDSTPWWVVEPQKLTDKKKVLSQIQSIQPAGGTEIYTAVQDAYQQLLKVDAQRKHIILLTDGQSSTNQSYDQLTANMVQNNMTLSSVAVGDGADVALLEALAKQAKGRFYFTNDQSTIPAIFSREAVIMARTYIVDQPFVPAVGQPGDWGTLFGRGVPQINAYVATTAKQTAEVALTSPEPDPLLARWQYGSGRTVAWTSDVTGKWSRDWVAWDAFAQTFTQIVKWTFPQFQDMPLELTTRLNGNEMKLGIKSQDAEFKGGLRASVTDEALQTKTLQVTPTAPGEYEAGMDISKPGVFLTRIDLLDESDPDRTLGSFTTGFVLSYSPEYRIGSGDPTAKLKQLADMTGGRMLSMERPEEVFQGDVTAKKQLHDLTRWLLTLAVLLWVLDIAVRRLSLPWGRLAALPGALLRRGRGTAAPKAPDAEAAMERLRERKRKVGAFYRGADAIQDAADRSRDSSSLLERGTEAAPAEVPQQTSTEQRSKPGTTVSKPAVSEATDKSAETMNRLLAAKNRRRR
ncbi:MULTISPECIES: VWA domain-containing protein [unclassified Paenibacillus]|uniref:VWA domain-containing protein n=1 Tax=unclassified Paenibacillus TaxID=185978 RepID=UPI002117B05E|nr:MULTISPECIES: VWA domain-containing protein [unclassified Paenibacillus]